MPSRRRRSRPRVHPICPSTKEEQIETYRSEPTVYAQMIAGKDAPCLGEAKNSWLTGTAAWTFVSVAEGLFGIKADFKGLKVAPCIPKSWSGFTATRKYRGVEYQIEVKNPNGVCKGVKSVTAAGKKVAGNVIPCEVGKKTVKVEITLEA